MVGHVRPPNGSLPKYRPCSGEFSFEVHVNHELKKKSGKHFLKEKESVFYDYADIDELSLLDLADIYEKCGGKIQNPKFYWKALTSESMTEISNDRDLLDMAVAANNPPRIIELFAIGENEVEDLFSSDVDEDAGGCSRKEALHCCASDEDDEDYKADEDEDEDDDDSDYEGNFEMASTDHDNEEFEENCNMDVEADLGRIIGRDGENEMEDYVEEESDFVDSDDRRTVHSSEDDSDDAHVSEFRVDRDMENPKFSLDQKFSSKNLLVEAIKTHSFIEHRPISFKKNDRKRLQAVCQAPCEWYIWASKKEHADFVQITRCKLEHSRDCSLTFNNKFATAKFLGNKLSTKMAADQKMSKNLLKQIMKEDYKEEVGDMKAYRFDLDIVDNPGWTFMSDKQKGLIPALDDTFPNCEKRHCGRHLYTNLQGACGASQMMKDLFWTAARATTVPEFHTAMQEISNYNKAAYEWLLNKPFFHWTRSHFLTLVSSDVLTSNMVESWNDTIMDERDMAPISMWEGIRRKLMLMYAKRRRFVKKWSGPLCPNIELKIKQLKKEALKWVAVSNGNGEFEVRWHNKQLVVNLKEKTCTCRKWELTGIPCEHAMQAIRKANKKLHDYVTACYLKETAAKIYQFSISPTAGKEHWGLSELGEVGVPAPIEGEKRGRPKKARRKEREEAAKGKKQKKDGMEVSKQPRRPYRCTTCGLVGHNKSFHVDQAGKEQARAAKRTDVMEKERKRKEREEEQRRKQQERSERNRLAALQKLEQKKRKLEMRQAPSQPCTVQVMPDGTTRRPLSEASQQGSRGTQGTQGSQIASQLTQLRNP